MVTDLEFKKALQLIDTYIKQLQEGHNVVDNLLIENKTIINLELYFKPAAIKAIKKCHYDHFKVHKDVFSVFDLKIINELNPLRIHGFGLIDKFVLNKIISKK